MNNNDNNIIIGELETPNLRKFTNDIVFQERLLKKTVGFELDLTWINYVTPLLPHIDNIFSNPKKFLKNEEEVLIVEKTKKVTTETVKHLTKHANFVDDYNSETGEVKPSKLLNVFKEDTYNTYENRFLYTLIDKFSYFLDYMENKIKDLDYKTRENFVYNGNNSVNGDDVRYSFVVDVYHEFNANTRGEILKMISKMRHTISGWKHTEVYMSYIKERLVKIQPPLKRTNVILKNPDFQLAAKLWDFLIQNDVDDIDENDHDKSNDHLPSDLQGFVNNTFAINYFTLKINNAANELVKDRYERELKKVYSTVLEDAIVNMMQGDDTMAKAELMDMVAEIYDNASAEKVIDYSIIENKIKSEIDNYLVKLDGCYFALEER